MISASRMHSPSSSRSQSPAPSNFEQSVVSATQSLALNNQADMMPAKIHRSQSFSGKMPESLSSGFKFSSDYEADLLFYRKETTDLKKEIDDLQTKLQDKENDRQTIDSLNIELGKRQKSLQNLEESHQTLLNYHKKTVLTLEDTVSQKDKKLSALEQESAHLKQEKFDLEYEKEDVIASYEQAREAAIAGAKLRREQKELERAEAINKAQNARDQANNRSRGLQKELTEANSKISSLTKENDDLQAQLSGREAYWKTIDDKNTQLSRTVNNQEETIADLKKNLKTVEVERDELSEALDETQDDFQRVIDGHEQEKDLNDKILKKNISLNEEIQEALNTSVAELSKLQTSLDTANKKIKVQSVTLNGVTKEKDDLTEKNQQLTKKVEQQQKNLALFQQQYKALKAEFEATQAERDALKAQVETFAQTQDVNTRAA